MLILVIVMVLLVVLGMLPLIMQVATGGTDYHCSTCGSTWYAFKDSGVQVVVLVIVMLPVVALGMLPLIMQVALWWYWL